MTPIPNPQLSVELLIQTALQSLQLQQLDQAEIGLLQALQINPKHAYANYLLGATLFQKGATNSALKAMQKAAKSDPNNAKIQNDLGSILQSSNQLQEAQKCFKKATTLDPKFAGAFNNLGVVYKQQGRYFEAEKCYQKATTLEPDYGDALNNLGLLQQSMGKLEDAVASFRQAIGSKKCQALAHSNLLLTLNYLPGLSRQQIYQEHQTWAKQLGRAIGTQNQLLVAKRGSKALLKIAYLSADFKAHSVAHFFEPLLGAHDHQRYQIYCYYNDQKEDQVTQRLKALTHQWRNISALSDQQVTEQIIADDIDILFDLNGHTRKNRLGVFARRAAPVQITWLGYPNTTGLDTMDYRLTDEIADPTGDADEFYSERLIRLPDGFLCFLGNSKVQPNETLPAAKNGFITFGSFNNLTKVTPQVIQLWTQILLANPESRLVIKSDRLDCKELQEQLLSQFETYGITRKRLKLYGNIAHELEHLKLYNSIDIALDSFPYNGTTTTCEALWMGVPVLTLTRETHASRVSASILTRVGLDAFIAHSAEDYLKLATYWANAPTELLAVKRSLRPAITLSALGDSQRFAASIEQACETIWQHQIEL